MALSVSIVNPVDIKNLPATIDADTPFIGSGNNTVDCDAALVTTITAFAVALLWYNQRSDAIARQKEIEDRILNEYDADNAFYQSVDHPQQIKAIDEALNLPECEIECEPCLDELTFSGGCYSLFGEPSCSGLDDYVKSMNLQGQMQARYNDRQNAKEQYVNCVQDQTTALIRATNLSHMDYSRAYAYYQNASAIQSGLAGMAAQGYTSAVSEFSMGLGLLGSGGN